MHLVFVYGSLLSGKHNNALLRRHNAELIGPARTLLSYVMYDLGSFPAVVSPEAVGLLVDLPFLAPVTGELYRVSEDCRIRLDQLEGYPTMYTREQVELDARPERPWMYVFTRPLPVLDHRMVPSCDWRAYTDERGDRR